MLGPKLTIHSTDQPERGLELTGDATIGRAFDNVICINDPGVSRYHAIIEKRGDGFFLSDLGSRNGTTLNHIPITSACKLRDGDLISIGDAGSIEFHEDRSEQQPEASSAEPVSASEPDLPVGAARVGATQAPPSRALIVAVGAGLLAAAVTALLLAGVFDRSETVVSIVYPQSGATIRGPEMIRVEASDASAIERVIYLLDGVEFASAEFPPFDVQIDPLALQTEFQGLASGNHILTLTIEDKEGVRKPQPDTVVLTFDMGGGKTADGASKPSDGGAPTDERSRGGARGAIDVAALSRNLAAQISGKSWYGFDAEFAEQIRLRTNDYRLNMINDARRYRREIGNAFGTKGLPLPLGFVMAISQSKFRNGASGSDQTIGFWRVPRQIAIEQGYIAQDEPPSSLRDPGRAAEIAAAYMKELINVFGMDDFMYSIACYGMPISQAAEVRVKLEESDSGASARKNFWSMVRRGVVPREGADRVVRFFAAGIVGENPKLFGLDAEPLSSLY